MKQHTGISIQTLNSSGGSSLPGTLANPPSPPQHQQKLFVHLSLATKKHHSTLTVIIIDIWNDTNDGNILKYVNIKIYGK